MFILDFSVILQCHTLTAPYFMFTVHIHKQSVTHKGCHLTGTFVGNKRTDDIIILRNNEFQSFYAQIEILNRNRLVELYLLEGDLIPFHSYRRSAVDLKLEVVKRNVLLNRLQNMRIFAYSSTREQSNERSGTKLKTESETGERVGFFSLARALRA